MTTAMIEPLKVYLERMNLFTVQNVADKYQITPQRVRQIAEARGIKGTTYGRMTLYTAEQVKAFKPGKPGRPAREAS